MDLDRARPLRYIGREWIKGYIAYPVNCMYNSNVTIITYFICIALSALYTYAYCMHACAYCRASEARPLIAVYSSLGDIARHVTAHVPLSRDGSAVQGVLLLLFGRSSLPACSRGRGAQKEMAMTRLRPARRGGHAARRCARLDTETAGQG